VQALKFESAASEQRSARSTASTISYDDSGLTDFLIVRGVANPVLGNRLYWYLMVVVVLEDWVTAEMYGWVVFMFMKDFGGMHHLYTNSGFGRSLDLHY
jgi:phosphatidylinositol 3-kinase